MSRYYINEASFDVPDEWPDQSINVFPSSRESSSEFSFVVSRDETKPGEDLYSYVDRQQEELLAQLPGFNLIHCVKTKLSGIDGVDTEFSWVSGGKQMHQRQICVVFGGRALVLTATAQEHHYQKYIQVLNQITDSFKFRGF